ncbi:porin family protein [Paenimyroides viscosum]|uniref:PorT family protein n=1 Tax=Paenimyroides viscosum TaxID=2488729 RepID=A0A3P1ATR5_9FLAO|nr:porin family protein [Paenimyroides viscosum]RRA92304.1 PorT family protein [Paenimyroides viscosum]
MKKVILAAFVLGTITTAVAQQQVKFGPKAGLNFANLSGDDNSDMLTGFHVGAVAEIKFNEKFSIQPEVVYSAQGSSRSGSTTLLGITSSFEGKQKLDYINVPIMAKYYIIDGFSVEAGPQIGFLMKAESELDTTIAGVNSNVKGDNKDSFKSTDFGLGLGLAYDLPVGLFVNARYNLGLSDIRENTSAGDAVKNNVIQVGIGYKFD